MGTFLNLENSTILSKKKRLALIFLYCSHIARSRIRNQNSKINVLPDLFSVELF